jgi:succinyl-diaminopimelate desuccinylase
VTDLLGLTAELVDIPSVSHDEAALATMVEAWLSEHAPGVVEVRRIGDNVCARTSVGKPERLVLAGHLDTVPPNANERAVLEGDRLSGLGSADMKGGLAVFLGLAELAASLPASRLRCDLTWLFYVCEEVERQHSGLFQIEAADPSLVAGTAAVLGEPTASFVEAGCQGVLKVAVEVRGERAHTARPWMGVNAIHRLAPLLAAVASYDARRPVIDGCEFHEALQAVSVSGGVANNVVPDAARVVLNHRFAPDRTVDEAFAHVHDLLVATGAIGEGDTVTLEDFSAPAAPGLDHPMLASLVSGSGSPPRAKLGWTDVAFFAERGVPAVNFGPGEPTIAHTAGEFVTRDKLEAAFDALAGAIFTGG